MGVRSLDWEIERGSPQTFLVGLWYDLGRGLCLELLVGQAVAHHLLLAHVV